ncbi:MAG: hypothetical protein KatS3mg057_0161 [Herpetosiphonaceae bacterium]|nr:MAG: hypothetical protein KatS3mg057_0161 [Herpetosiphonaceae bacterium]
MAGIEPLEGLRLPGPRLALAWLALLLSAWLVGGARHRWIWALPLALLFPVAWIPQFVLYVPACALLAGLYALAWRRIPASDQIGPSATLLWVAATALPYLLLILGLLPGEATLPALAASVTLAVVAAVRAGDAGTSLILGAGALRLALLLARLLSGPYAPRP